MKGFGAYLLLEMRRTVRSVQFLVFAIGFPLVFYLLFSAMFGAQTLGTVSANVYLMVSMGAYGAMGAAINANSARLAAERTTGWSRDLRVTPLGIGAYTAVKTVLAFVLALPGFAVVAAAAVLVHHVAAARPTWWTSTAATWLDLFALMWLGSLPFAVLGVLLGYVFNAESAQAGSMIVYLGLALLGAMWIPIRVMPSTLAHVALWLPSYRYADLGWRVVAGQPASGADVAILAAYALGMAVLAGQLYRRDEARNYA